LKLAGCATVGVIFSSKCSITRTVNDYIYSAQLTLLAIRRFHFDAISTVITVMTRDDDARWRYTENSGTAGE